ncbi:MAG: glycosyltransferase, partial [Chloroflexales bacterium]|nr:glycosyltransferase [Chloroflexales bacterium]
VDQTSAHEPKTTIQLNALIQAGAIRYFHLDQPSLPNARNFGTQQARGELVLFVDDDIIPGPNLIAAHAAAYNAPDIGGVAGRRTFPVEPMPPEPSTPVGVIARNSTHVSNFSATAPQHAVEWASGCNMSFRRRLIAEAGGFDTMFGGSATYEDVDFCFRLRRYGYRIVFAPQAHLVHLQQVAGGCGSRRRSPRFYYFVNHNSLLFALRHLPWRDLPRVLAFRTMMGLVLARQYTAPHLALIIVPAAAAALRTHLRTTPRWVDGRPASADRRQVISLSDMPQTTQASGDCGLQTWPASISSDRREQSGLVSS